MWFCRKASSRSWSCRQARGRELKRVAGERERQFWEEIESKKTNNWLTRNKGYRHFFRCRISSGHQAQQYRLCFAFAEVKIKVFHFRLRRRWHLRFLNAAFRKDFRVLRNLKSLIEILYRFIKVGFHFLSGFKVNIADTGVFHLVCGTGKYQRALNLRTGKPSINLCPGLKVK